MTRRPDRRRVVAIGALIGVIALAVGGLAFAGSTKTSTSSSSGSSTTSTVPATTTTTIDPETLPPTAKELYRLVQKGTDATFHALYLADSPEYASQQATATIEVWRSGSKARLDQVLVSPTETQRSSGFAGPTGTIICNQVAGKPVCQLTGSGFQDIPQRFLAAVGGQLRTIDVQATDEPVGAYPARCFTLGGDVTGRLCLDPATGALLLLDSGGLTYQATQLDDHVSDRDFIPPGPVFDVGGNPVAIPGQTSTTR